MEKFKLGFKKTKKANLVYLWKQILNKSMYVLPMKHM